MEPKPNLQGPRNRISASARLRRQPKSERDIAIIIDKKVARFDHPEPGDMRAQRMWITARNESNPDFELPGQILFLSFIKPAQKSLPPVFPADANRAIDVTLESA